MVTSSESYLHELLLLFVVVVGKQTATCTGSSVITPRGIITIATSTTSDGAFYGAIVDDRLWKAAQQEHLTSDSVCLRGVIIQASLEVKSFPKDKALAK